MFHSFSFCVGVRVVLKRSIIQTPYLMVELIMRADILGKQKLRTTSKMPARFLCLLNHRMGDLSFEWNLFYNNICVFEQAY